MKHNLLHIYEEIVLLALRDTKGTFSTRRIEYLISGAVLAELQLNGSIVVGESKKLLVEVNNTAIQSDSIMQECFSKIQASCRQLSLKTWVERLSKIKELRHKVAMQLCERKILFADKQTILFIFTKKIYPEINPQPEKLILERLHSIIFSSDPYVDPRSAVLIALAKVGVLLDEPFGKSEIRKVKDRINKISNASIVGQATQQAIETCEANEMVTTTLAVV